MKRRRRFARAGKGVRKKSTAGKHGRRSATTLLRRKPRLGQKKLRSRIAAGRRGIRRRRLGGGGAPNKGYQQAYNEGYHSGFAKGFEDGHQSAYEQQV